MSESNLSISFEAEETFFKSKNAKKRLKEELKKAYHMLENKEDFLLISNEKTGYFTKFLNDIYQLEIVKNSEMNYTVKVIENLEKKTAIQEEQTIEDKRAQFKNKLKNMKDMRSNQTGRKIKEMRKEVGDDMIKKFLLAQQAMGGQSIPDPSEIMRNKGKYLQQFQEYQEMIKNMKEKNPQLATMLEVNPYHKYANEVSKQLEIPLD
jgi:hypothetical protein